ncbi:uncharacterized protein LOC129097691 [Anoplopoma fimbria]|uniref:uncharacterized protein LOC129097691 n=1 Tax=Anoplopoma fimbria TaxID=229290 RepID=UPI0023EA9A21|nr:uncharacterized protein LOC129097691 [Anoplopoma fimbria]
MKRSAGQLLDMPTKQRIKEPQVLDAVIKVAELLSTIRHKTIDLKKPAGAKWTIGNLDDTIYSGKENVVYGWNKFYLQDKVSMQVVGKVEGTSCPCGQLVLMTCEDKKVYAYDGEELHLVASSLKQLIEEGIEYPSDKTYYEGEAFKNMTDKDWEKVRKGPEGKRLDEEHRKLVTAKKSKFLESLLSINLYDKTRSLELLKFDILRFVFFY